MSAGYFGNTSTLTTRKHCSAPPILSPHHQLCLQGVRFPQLLAPSRAQSQIIIRIVRTRDDVSVPADIPIRTAMIAPRIATQIFPATSPAIVAATPAVSVEASVLPDVPAVEPAPLLQASARTNCAVAARPATATATEAGATAPIRSLAVAAPAEVSRRRANIVDDSEHEVARTAPVVAIVRRLHGVETRVEGINAIREGRIRPLANPPRQLNTETSEPFSFRDLRSVYAKRISFSSFPPLAKSAMSDLSWIALQLVTRAPAMWSFLTDKP